MEVRGKLAAKAGNGKGFKVEGQEGWFNASDSIKSTLASIEKGIEVVVTYEKKGIAMIASKIVTTTSAPVAEKQPSNFVDNPEAKSPGTSVCEDCGKELKDDKYKKCYMCGKKAYKGKKEFIPNKSNYGSAEDIAGKEVGCAANCASTLLSGRTEEPEVLLELFRILCNGILEHIRTLK